MKRLLLSCVCLVACGGSQKVEGPPPKPAKSGALFVDGDVVAYEIWDQRDRALGRVHSTYHEADGTMSVVTRVEIDPSRLDGRSGASPVQTEHATSFSRSLVPRSYKRLSSIAGRLDITFRDDGLSIVNGPQTNFVRREKVETPLLPADDLMMLALLLHASRVEPGESSVMRVFLPDALNEQPWDLRVWIEASGETVVQLPVGQLVLDEQSRIERFDLTARGWSFRRERPPQDPPRIQVQPPLIYERPPAATWEDRKVEVTVDGGAMSGVLSVPEVRTKWPKNVAPGVIFLSDAGPQDRHGFQGQVDVGTWELLDKLSDEGFCVLRVDDRGIAGSAPDASPVAKPLDVQVADGRALVRFMAAQPEVDSEKIFIVGHGTGGVAAATVASMEPVAGLMLLATPYRSVYDAKLPAIFEKLKGPVIVFQGMKDFQVSWKEDAEPLVSLLTAKLGRDHVTFKAYARVDHLMKVEPKTSTAERYLDRSRRVEPTFLDDAKKWLLKHATAK